MSCINLTIQRIHMLLHMLFMTRLLHLGLLGSRMSRIVSRQSRSRSRINIILRWKRGWLNRVLLLLLMLDLLIVL